MIATFNARGASPLPDGFISDFATFNSGLGTIKSARARVLLEVVGLSSGYKTIADDPELLGPAPTPLAPVAPTPFLRTRTANNAADLVNFAVNSLPGDLVVLLPGTTYNISASPITQTVAGTLAHPITIRGAGVSSVVILGASQAWKPMAAWLRYENFRVTNGFYAFFCGGSTGGIGPGVPNVVFDQLLIDNMQQEGILLQHGTTFGYVQRCTFKELGILDPRFGEGVYVGGYGVASTDCKVLQNNFGPNVRAEAIDNSAGSHRTIIESNVINCQTVPVFGQTNSPIAIRGDDVQVTKNTVVGGAPNCIDVYTEARRAIFRGNDLTLNTNAFGIRFTGAATGTIYSDNVVKNILSGGAAYNIPTTPAPPGGGDPTQVIGGFNIRRWKTKMAAAETKMPSVAAYVLDGTMIGTQALTDIESGTNWAGRPPTFQEIEDAAFYAKTNRAGWTNAPVFVRARNSFLKGKGSPYLHLDAGMAIWTANRGNPLTWYQQQIADGVLVGLGCVLGFDLLNGGAGTETGWKQHPDSPTLFGMSPTEIIRCADAINTVSADTCMILVVAYENGLGSSDYANISLIRTALQYVYDLLKLKTAGPINRR